MFYHVCTGCRRKGRKLLCERCMEITWWRPSRGRLCWKSRRPLQAIHEKTTWDVAIHVFPANQEKAGSGLRGYLAYWIEIITESSCLIELSTDDPTHNPPQGLLQDLRIASVLHGCQPRDSHGLRCADVRQEVRHCRRMLDGGNRRTSFKRTSAVLSACT
jgi:hypothetical protein